MSSSSIKKQVTFNPFVAVRKVIPLKGANLWYQQNDFQIMKSEIRRTIQELKQRRKERATGNLGLCTRGLEDHLVKNPQIIRERRMKTALIVLLEHDRQLDEEGVSNSDKLACRLHGISQRSAQRARRRALHDESVASRIYDPPLITATTQKVLMMPSEKSNISCMKTESSTVRFNLLMIRDQNSEQLPVQSDTNRIPSSTSVVSANLLFCVPSRSFQDHPRS